MSSSTRNLAIVAIALLTSTVVAAQGAGAGLDAVVSALDRNTQAQRRTCEAIALSGNIRGSAHSFARRRPERWQVEQAQRCWR